MQRLLLIGKNGQVGWELQRTCCTLGEVIALDYPDVDISQSNSLRELIQTIKPNIIINAAAYTDVDKAESEPELARKVNAFAPAIMAEEAKKINAAFIHYSTDYVFDGTKGSSYIENDKPNPINIYGTTKLEGEEFVQGVGGTFLIFRTSWVYSTRHGGFVSKVLEWAKTQEVLRIVDDQIGSPTWARILAEVTAIVIAQGHGNPVEYFRKERGLYNLAGSGFCSRFEMAKVVLELKPDNASHDENKVIRAKSYEFITPAQRPCFSALECQKFKKNFGLEIPNWRESVRLALGIC